MNQSVPLVFAAVSAYAAVVFAQMPPGTDKAIEAAANRGYEAVVLVLIVLVVFGLFAWAIRGWITQAQVREERLAKRVTDLENIISTTLIKMATDTTAALNLSSASSAKLTEALVQTRPCWWTPEKQAEVLAEAADRIAEHLIQIVEKRLAEKWAAMKGDKS